MKILVDTNGGDHAPFEIIKGAVEAAKEYNIEIGFVGIERDIEQCLKDLETDSIRYEIFPANEKIENSEEPAFAIRKKRESSIVVGLNALKQGKADAFVSAGSTGALLAGGLFIVGRIPGIKRAVLPTFIPGYPTETMIIDSGANMDCDSELLDQFARMGSCYLRCLKNMEQPKVGLLNIGSEPGKGNSLTKESYEVLSNAPIHFIGNVEARDITNTEADLVVCDGFDGNILLKSMEGTASFVFQLFRKQLENSNMELADKMKIGSFVKNFASKFDATEVGGTLLLGLQKLVIKAHGNSNAKAIKNAIAYAYNMNQKNMIRNIEENFRG